MKMVMIRVLGVRNAGFNVKIECFGRNLLFSNEICQF